MVSLLQNAKSHNYNPIPKQADNSPTIFAIIGWQIKLGRRWTFKYLAGVVKVNTVFTNVLLVFVLVPFKISHEKLSRVPFDPQLAGSGAQSADMKASLQGGSRQRPTVSTAFFRPYRSTRRLNVARMIF